MLKYPIFLMIVLSINSLNVIANSQENEAVYTAEIDALLQQSEDEWGKSSDISLQAAQQAYQKAIELNDIARQARALRHQSIAYWYKDDYAKVVEQADKALTLFKQVGDKKGIAASLNTIATTHLNLENYEQAKKSYREALDIALEINDRNRQATVLQNLGTVAIAQKELTLAEEYLLDSLEIRKQIPHVFNEMTLMANLAGVYRRTNKLNQSFEILDKLIAMATSENNFTRLGDAYADYATTYVELGKLPEAIEFYLKAIEIAQEHELLRILESTSKDLSNTYQMLEDNKNAYQYFALYSNTREKRLSEENSKLLAELDAKYEMQKNRAVILEQQSQLEQEKFVSKLYLFGLVASVLVAGMLFKIYWLKKRSADELHFLSRTDNLTGLKNRRAFTETISEAFARFEESAEHISIIIIDIDNFKAINDTFGHLVGDTVLESVSKMIKATARENDFCARWGGEEFILYLPKSDLERASKIAERIRTIVEQTKIESTFIDKVLNVTVTCGVAQVRESETLETLTDRADKALYSGKTSGKNKVVLESI